jgi:membrane-bound PQQ-dependent dehydrogenase (glucose/quinate/shikimate family)
MHGSKERTSEARPLGRSRSFGKAFAALLVLLGLPLLAGGCWLVALDGSPYFVAVGLGLVVSGILLWRGSRWSVVLFAAMLLATWVLALAEAGFDFWVLLARLGFLIVLGTGFLLPWVRRNLTSGPHVRHGGLLATAATVLLLGATAVIGWVEGDPAEQRAPAEAGQSALPATRTADIDWQNYGNDPGGTRYSPLDQINRSNVNQLTLAWTYRTGDYPPPAGPVRRLEVTPIKIGDSLYLCSGRNKVVALDAGSGRERWSFDPHVDTSIDPGSSCRGVAYHKRAAVAGTDCVERILEATQDARLLAVDARTGRPCRGFGSNGQVDLTAGLGHVIPGYVSVSSAPVVVRDKVVVGSRISDGQFVGEPGGAIRAYDVVTGELSWVFDPGNPADNRLPADGKTLVRGTPNSWAPMSADPALGLVFVPTGNATPDYWGGFRTALDDRYSSAVIAIDVETGRERWTFQTTHHDLWDYDVSSQPSLIDLPIGGRIVPALLQPTKRGQLFLLDRRTGRPLAPIVERPAPQDGVPGERLAPTQPYSVGMPALDGLPVSESGLWGLTPYDDLWCHIRFRQAKWDGPMTAPSDRFYLQMPSSLGGMNWGSATIDPDRGVAYVPWNTMPMRNRLMPRKEADDRGVKPIGPGGEVGGVVAQAGTPYGSIAAPFVSPFGVPCVAPPYGRLSAIDLRSRRIVWTRRLGLASANRVAGVRMSLPILMGVPISGGSLATRGGLVFIGAVGDNQFRAFDARTGETLWKAHLPAAANATPMSYMTSPNGKQMIVVAAGGHPMMQTDPGDYIMAFTLKK